MKRWAWLLCALLLIAAPCARAQRLQDAVGQTISGMELGGLDEAVEQSGLFADDAAQLLARLASGRPVLTWDEVAAWLTAQVTGVFQNSLWRMTRLLAPALLATVAETLHRPGGAAGKAARYAGLLMTMAILVSDLSEHVRLAEQTVGRMTGWMQSIFPLLVTLLAAVGGTASSAFYQPAVIAAAGAMTTLVEHVTMPVAVGVASLTMVGGLGEDMRVSRICRLMRQAANWTLGFGFTVFIGVMSVQGISAAAVDGVSIRTAKYAMDNFIPVVGGMFADTVDTLVGCSLLVENAVGVLGLLLLLAALLLPLLRTVMTMFLYRAASALLQPLSDSPLCRALGEYGDVFSLLFIIQLSVGAMLLVLVAQLLLVGNLTVMLR